MTMHYKVLVGGTTEPGQIENIIQEVFQRIDLTFNKWNPHSEVSAFNRSAKGVATHLSPPLSQFLELVGIYVALSEGRFDPSIEPVQKVWKHFMKQGIEPAPEDIQEAISATGWGKFTLKDGVIVKSHSDVALDLGGVAKGLAIDNLVEAINHAGFSNIYVEWGGEIRTAGEHPTGRPWRVFISNLGSERTDHHLGVLELGNQAVATSGDYLQFWKVGEKTFTHIINPLTAKPLEVTSQSIASATVVASNCALADFIATTLMLFPTQEAANAWVAEMNMIYPDVQVFLQTRAS